MRVVLAALAAMAAQSAAQTSAVPPANAELKSFEAASVKPTAGFQNGWSVRRTASQTLLVHIPLRECIQMAFGLKNYSLEGPGWIDVERFEVAAKMPAGASNKDFNAMLQNLLVERFRMKFHRTSKMVNGYALVEGKGGFKPKPIKNQSGGGPGSSGSSDSNLWGIGVPMSQLADMLSRQLDLPVQNMTGITKVLDFDLVWMPDSAALANPNDPGISIFTALQEQLGLKLEKQKLPVEVLVIDQIDRTPIEN